MSSELGPADTKVDIKVDTLKYDASVFALGALGTTVFLFVNGLVGGVLDAGGARAGVRPARASVAAEIKAEAKEQAPLAVDRVAALVGPKLDEIVDGFGARLLEFVAAGGRHAGARDRRGARPRARRAPRAPTRRRRARPTPPASTPRSPSSSAIDERIADIRQSVWSPDGDPAAAAPPGR